VLRNASNTTCPSIVSDALKPRPRYIQEALDVMRSDDMIMTLSPKPEKWLSARAALWNVSHMACPSMNDVLERRRRHAQEALGFIGYPTIGS